MDGNISINLKPFMKSTGVDQIPVLRIDADAFEQFTDTIVVEEPLEISLEYGPSANRRLHSLAVTMRTPGNDQALALGFLLSEGIISKPEDVVEVRRLPHKKGHQVENTILVALSPGLRFDMDRLNRHFYTSSSCGVCGKTSIEMVQSTIYHFPRPGFPKVHKAVFYELPEKLRRAQAVFDSTGSIHASGLFDANGNLLLLQEDVGRHNALDKLLGQAFEENQLPFKNQILLLSGRISFELVQKALMAGVPVIAAVGAPSSLAVEMAEAYGTTLIGFLRNNKFNVYCGKDRIIVD